VENSAKVPFQLIVGTLKFKQKKPDKSDFFMTFYSLINE
jgi:hypothetical protein